MKTAVFLSASVPDPLRDARYYTTADFSAIREAVVALTLVALRVGRLVFGGHPAISPLVLVIARQLQAVDRVRIFQSEFFRNIVPAESLAFPSITWIPAVDADQMSSLLAMRKAMLASEPLRAGVFIGGMEGVEEEYELFRQIHPALPAYAIPTTGAAAGILFHRDAQQPPDPALRQALSQDLVYDALFRSLPGVP